jgi:hypothetical protein
MVLENRMSKLQTGLAGCSDQQKWLGWVSNVHKLLGVYGVYIS